MWDTVFDKILNEEVHFHFSHSWWHGGQNVNKRETKAELYFNIQESKHLTPEQKERLTKLWAKRVHHHSSTLIMTCQEERYQEANKKKVIHHFKELLLQALIEPKKRIATKIPKHSKEERIQEKKIVWKKKQDRNFNDFN